jgi:adenosyl cobinamide kinase/adenosyl cobinamide phosphate guanylyltransferase
MAQNRSYYSTTAEQLTDDELSQRIARCKNQDYKIYEIFKVFGTMTKWDVYDIYNQYHGNILDSSVGRSMKSLVDAGVIEKTDIMVEGDMGVPNTLYRLKEDAPVEIPTNRMMVTPKIVVQAIFITNENGFKELDMEAMSEEFIDKLDKLNNQLN